MEKRPKELRKMSRMELIEIIYALEQRENSAKREGTVGEEVKRT